MSTIHGTAVVLGARGVLILGASGSGKTTLALELVRRARDAGSFAALVGDDQLIAEEVVGRLVVTVPGTIAGLAEVYGFGPVAVDHVSSALIDLVVTLVGATEAPRYQDISPSPSRPPGEPGGRDGEGDEKDAPLPHLILPERNVSQSASVVFAQLGLGRFAGMRQNG